jgi:DNA invertase Pin-like site-specific DNA recombinase
MATLTNDEYIMYLRKSRADNPYETVEEVLEKHETILQELAERDLGGRIPEHCIYREVVSGETIDERPEMLAVLAQIENPRLKGVLVVEPQRLSRGDLEDCGKIVNAFRYSKTEVITTNMVYDLTNKMQRKFFEQELMRGNDYLEYTKEILLRGRIAAVKRGCYIGNIPPFGFNKIIDADGDSTLEANEYADAVLMAFEMYVNEGKTYLQIARHFDNLGIKPYRSEVWEKSSIRAMLKNRHYIGMVVFGARKSEKVLLNGAVSSRSVAVAEEETIIAKGKHNGIVPLELFDAAQEKMDRNPRNKLNVPLVNPLAGLIFCHKCGKAMAQHPYPHARTRIECRNRGGCNANSTYLDDVVDAVAFALEHEQLPEMEVKLHNDEGKAATIQKKQLEKMNQELEELYAKEERQHDFLESGTYTEDVFLKRNKAVHAQIEELKSKIFEAKKNIPKEINYADKIVKIKEALKGLRDDSLSPEAKNILLKAIVGRIEYEFIERYGKGKVRFRLHVKLLL